MEFPESPIFEKDVETSAGLFRLTISEQNMSSIYPGMIRYTVMLFSGSREVAVFRTNTYEYTPTDPLDAKESALKKTAEWEAGLRGNTELFLASLAQRPVPRSFQTTRSGVIIIQGSPRADGNCSILAEWIVESASKAGEHALVIYPHDMDIRSCIGCYQCYNTCTCTYDDDMTPIIAAVRLCRLLVVCTPVYTNTVPGGLKVVIDRFQAYHAERSIKGGDKGRTGLLVSVAGREGKEPFRCITRVVIPFFQNIGISPCREILVDGVDRIHDIRRIDGLKEKIESEVLRCLAHMPE